MTTFKEYNDVVDRLKLTVNGKEYLIPELSVKDRLRYEEAISGDGEPMTDSEFEHLFMGDVLDQMRADNVPEKSIDRALQSGFTYAVTGKDAAQIMWETGGHPKAIEEYVKARLPNRASRRSRSTAAASTTQSPKRTTGTTSRRK